MKEEELQELIAQANKILKAYGSVVTGVGPDSVGVQGDARVVGPTLCVSTPIPLIPPAEWGVIATKIINEVPGITRILVDL